MFLITYAKNFSTTFLALLLKYHIYLFMLSIVGISLIFILKIKGGGKVRKLSVITLSFLLVFINFFWQQLNLVVSFTNFITFYYVEVFFFFMVGVLICFYKSDDRQKVFKVFPKKSKYAKYADIKDPYYVWAQPKPLETLVMLDTDETLDFYTETTTGANFLHFSLPSSNHYLYYLYLRINSGRVYTPLDFSYTSQLNASCIVSSCYFSSFFLVTHSVHTAIDSISTIYSSFNWVEREVLEFSDVYINGLKDSRRLLTDYTVLSIDNQSYKTTSYDGLTQNLYFE